MSISGPPSQKVEQVRNVQEGNLSSYIHSGIQTTGAALVVDNKTTFETERVRVYVIRRAAAASEMMKNCVW